MNRVLVPLIVIGGAVLDLGLTTACALDLTPNRGFRQGNEGPPTPVLKFTDGKTQIDFRPPAGWEPSGGGKAVGFVSPETGGAWMKLLATEKKNTAVPGFSATKEELCAWAGKFVPPQAEKLEFLRTLPSPFTVGSRPSTEFVFAYVFFGARVSVSICVVDFNEEERLLMLVSADGAQFERVRQDAIASMFSWCMVE